MLGAQSTSMDMVFGAFTRSLHIALANEAFSRSLLSNDWLPHWHPDNPTMGHCAAASEALYFAAGGPLRGLRAMAASYSENGRRATHWWLSRPPAGRIWDPTAEPFLNVGCLPPYQRVVFEPDFKARIAPCGFQGQRKISKNEPDLWGVRPEAGHTGEQVAVSSRFLGAGGHGGIGDE